MLTRLILLLSIVVVTSASFGYGENDGPNVWPEGCQKGRKQSPIDIRAPDVDMADLPRIFFVNFEMPGKVVLKNNGHTIIGTGFEEWGGNRPYMYGGGLNGTYNLIQYHLHWSQDDTTGSEHTIASLHFPSEVHFVFLKDGRSFEDGKPMDWDTIAVVGVFVAIASDASPFSILQKHLKSVIEPETWTTMDPFNLLSLLPRNLESFYRYNGSLTTPGCEEAVVWTVLTEPISVTHEQMKVLRSVKFDGGSVGHNFRPIRSLNGRRVLLRRSFSQQIIRKGDDEEREDDIVWYMRLMNKVSNLFRSVIWRRE